MAQLVKNLPAVWETWVQSLGWEDLLEKGKATHSSILAWKIPWTLWGRKESDTTEWLSLSLYFFIVQWCWVYSHCCSTDLQNFFILHSWNSLPIKQQHLISHSILPQPLVTTTVLSVFRNLTILDISYKWSPTIFFFSFFFFTIFFLLWPHINGVLHSFLIYFT